MRFTQISVVLTFLVTTQADVQFTSPTAGAALPVGVPLTISWTDTGIVPLISQLSSYQLYLCAGGNDATTIIQLAQIPSSGQFSYGNQLVASIDPSLGANTPGNSYFFRMVSTVQSGGTIVNYSSRFTLTGMTGSFVPAVFVGMQDVGANINGPSKQFVLGQDLNNQHLFDPWDIPLDQQTGPIVYAPMQSYPLTKITKSIPTPQYPPSPYSIATTMMPPNPSVSKTMTQAITWSFPQRENPNSPAPGPSDDMQKFLNRWKD